jgi:hypothetical protein
MKAVTIRKKDTTLDMSLRLSATGPILPHPRRVLSYTARCLLVSRSPVSR